MTNERSAAETTHATNVALQAEPDPRRWWSLAVIAVAQLMIVLDASVVVVALPSAQRALHISIANRQWVMSAYTLAFGSLLLLGGRIADYLGRRRMFIVGLIGFGLSSALGGLARDAAMLFGARALQGAFAALMAPASLSLLTTTFTEVQERARAFGIYGAIAGGGAAVGLVLGGTLTQLASWRWTLLINVPIALVAVVGSLRVVRESRAPSRTGYDIPGAVAVTSGLFLLVYGFTMAGTDGWGAPLTLGLLAGAAAAVAAFVAIELRSPHPLLPMRVLLDRNRGGAFLASLLVGSALLGTFLFLTYFLQGTLGYSALKTGFAFLPFSGGIILGAGVASTLLPRVGPRSLMGTGLLLAAGGLAWFTRSGCAQQLRGPRAAAGAAREHRDGLGLRTHVLHGPHRGRHRRRRGGQCSCERHPAGRGFAGHSAFEHRGRFGGRGLPGCAPAQRRCRSEGSGSRLHHGVHRERGPARSCGPGRRGVDPGLPQPGTDRGRPG